MATSTNVNVSQRVHNPEILNGNGCIRPPSNKHFCLRQRAEHICISFDWHVRDAHLCCKRVCITHPNILNRLLSIVEA